MEEIKNNKNFVRHTFDAFDVALFFESQKIIDKMLDNEYKTNNLSKNEEMFLRRAKQNSYKFLKSFVLHNTNEDALLIMEIIKTHKVGFVEKPETKPRKARVKLIDGK